MATWKIGYNLQELRGRPRREVWRAASLPKNPPFLVVFAGEAGKHHQKR